MTEYGDIMSIADEGKAFTKKFHIECRHGKCIKVADLIHKPAKSSMVQFIKEGEIGAKKSNRLPLWIFREQSKPVMILMKYDDYCYGVPQQLSLSNNIVMALFPVYELVLFTFDNFKKHYNKKSIRDKNGN